MDKSKRKKKPEFEHGFLLGRILGGLLGGLAAALSGITSVIDKLSLDLLPLYLIYIIGGSVLISFFIVFSVKFLKRRKAKVEALQSTLISAFFNALDKSYFNPELNK